MKRMCLVMLAALAIIICVIAFQSFRESREEVYDGILIEEVTDEYKLISLPFEEKTGMEAYSEK